MVGWQDWINKGVKSFFDYYNSPSQNEFDYNVKQFARNLPFIGSIFQAEDNSHRMNDYLTNRGLNWSNIRYNQAPFGATYGSSLAGMTPNVSAMSLYKNVVGKSRSKSWKGPQYSFRNRDMSFNSKRRMMYRPEYQLRRSKYQF